MAPLCLLGVVSAHQFENGRSALIRLYKNHVAGVGDVLSWFCGFGFQVALDRVGDGFDSVILEGKTVATDDQRSVFFDPRFAYNTGFSRSFRNGGKPYFTVCSFKEDASGNKYCRNYSATKYRYTHSFQEISQHGYSFKITI